MVVIVQYNIFQKVPVSERTDYKMMLSTWQIAMTLYFIAIPVETLLYQTRISTCEYTALLSHVYAVVYIERTRPSAS